MSKVIKDLKDKCNVQMPICTEIYEILYNNKSVKEAALSLLSREQKAE